LPGAAVRENAILAFDDRLDDLAAGQRQQHEVRIAHHFAHRCGRLRARVLHVLRERVVAEHRDTGIDNAARHASAHIAEPDKSDSFLVHDVLQKSTSWVSGPISAPTTPIRPPILSSTTGVTDSGMNAPSQFI
jgi:hypothetical protein